MNLAEQAPSDRRVAGGAFHPDLPNGRASGEVTISFTAVQFKSDKGDFDLPAEGMKIELGGANDRLIFFSHPTHPKVTIHTADHSILNHPMLVNNPELRGATEKSPRTGNAWRGRCCLGVCGSVVALLLGLFLARDTMVRTAAKGGAGGLGNRPATNSSSSSSPPNGW
jgi:hypothetical protein